MSRQKCGRIILDTVDEPSIDSPLIPHPLVHRERAMFGGILIGVSIGIVLTLIIQYATDRFHGASK